jgi:spore maturation protein CgeB
VKLLLVHPGASWSTADVHQGLRDAFVRAGSEVVDYALDGRIATAGAFLQQAWKLGGKRKGRPSDADATYLASEGAIGRALRFQPDWVFIVAGMYFHPDVVVLLRRAHLRVAMLMTESPYDDEAQLRLVPYLDAVWTNERGSLAKFRALNPNSHYYQHAIDLSRHTPGAHLGDENEPAHDVVFVGTGWQERVDLLKGTDWSGIDLGLYGTWQMLGSRSRLRQYVRGSTVPNARTAALYRRAKMGLNLHRASPGAESVNPRCYELAACGVPFTTDYRAEMAEVFGDLVPVFTTGSELRAVLDRYLAEPGERARLSRELLGCVAEHTFDARAKEILKVLEA